jgi:hypothetical protein
MKGLSCFPLEIECKIILFAMIQPPIDLHWNRRVMESWGLTNKNIMLPDIINPIKMCLGKQQQIMVDMSWVAIFKREESLLIESYTRSGKTTALTFLLYTLHYLLEPNISICYFSLSLRRSYLAKETFFEFLNEKRLPENISFEPITSKNVRGKRFDIVIYDCGTMVSSKPFGMFQTVICCYSRWQDPRGHLGLDKTYDAYPGIEHDAIRNEYNLILSLPQKGDTKLSFGG